MTQYLSMAIATMNREELNTPMQGIVLDNLTGIK
jgi:hypothetical protein